MSHVLIQDPNDISTRFSMEDALGYEAVLDYDKIIERELSISECEEAELDFTAIEKFLPRIPPREADLIILYHRDRMKQEQIAKLFNITQAAVSYRLHRGIRRIQFLRTIPELEKDNFDLELGSKFSDQDREILWLMYETTCQSAIAKQMGLTQGRVRHRFFRSLGKIKELIAEEAREAEINMKLAQKRGQNVTEQDIKKKVDETITNSKFAKYWRVFWAISDKRFNILHEVSLPQFANRGDAQILSGG